MTDDLTDAKRESDLSRLVGELRRLLAEAAIAGSWTVSAPDAPLAWRIEDGSGGHMADVVTPIEAALIVVGGAFARVIRAMGDEKP